jgi:hypothetical protein
MFTARTLMHEYRGMIIAEIYQYRSKHHTQDGRHAWAVSISVKHMATHQANHRNGPHVCATPADRPRREGPDLQGHRTDKRRMIRVHRAVGSVCLNQ